MSLPEVLISIVVTTTLVAAMAMSISVIIKQADNTEGRLNNARSEQNVGLWLPSDLASAEDVELSAGASPCGASCPATANVGGSNALMLTWHTSIPGATQAIDVINTVSYRYVETGATFSVVRVQCESIGGAAPTCHTITVLHDVLPPPPGIPWVPGSTTPEWVMLVNLALDPADTGSGTTIPLDPSYSTKNGRRVTVTINGGGDLAGAGGGIDTITLTAGGTDRSNSLSTTAFSDPPSFAATRSRCGGNFGMLVDTSGSIGSNMASVRTGIIEFIDAFAGTPIQLQVVRFSSTAQTLGANPWYRYYNMLVESDVAELRTLVGALSSSGSTNWEDGMFRMFYNNDGTVQPTLPDTLIFFTDGMPTSSRLQATSASAPVVAVPSDASLPGQNSTYYQVGWNRASRVARQFDADVERFIGVFVGTDVNGTNTWRELGPGYHWENFIRGYNFTWSRGYRLTTWERGSRDVYERSSNGMTYEKRQSDLSWSSSNGKGGGRTNYETYNTVAGESDGYRARVSGTLGSWTTTTTTNYNRSNITADSTDGFRVTRTYTSPYDIWETATESAYTTGNTSWGETDGWRATKLYSSPFTGWDSATNAEYSAGNTIAGDTDGWRETKNYSSPYTYWEATTEALYNAGNTVAGNTDGWDAGKVYSEPYTAWESPVTSVIANSTILARIITTGAPVPAAPNGGPYTNSAVADMYILPAWNQFSAALTSVALAECGGTLTVQTKVGSVAASDPFTYQNSVDQTVATTSSQYKSGTFDFDIPSGQSINVTLTPQNNTGLSRYSAVSWVCKAAGATLPITTTAIAGSPWSSVTVAVRANQAVSCVHTVAVS